MGENGPIHGFAESASAAPSRVRTFTVSEANAVLPLVRAIVADLVELARDVTQRLSRLLSLSRSDRRDGSDPYEQELLQMEQDLEEDGRRIMEYLKELRQLGVEAKSATHGLVDFPAMLGGRMIYLCWQLGEPEVSYWHECDAGYRGRQRIDWIRAEGDETGKPSKS